MEFITDPSAWAALLTLTVLEIVLGVDNIIFISILTGKLPKEQQPRARMIGLSLAMLMRIGLLFSLTWLMRLTVPLFSALGNEISGRDLVLIIGGLFLLGKSTMEIHENLEGVNEDGAEPSLRAGFASVLVQIMLLDIVFSLDSVITAIGMSDQIIIMVLAVMIAVVFMMVAAASVSEFIDKHPTVKVLAMSFLLLIGVALIADGLDRHIPKGYIYFAMAFSVMVEMLNLRLRAKARKPVQLRKGVLDPSKGS